MTERERAVDNLITKARYAAGVYAVLPPECRKPHEHDLKVAVDRFLEADAHDAAPKPLAENANYSLHKGADDPQATPAGESGLTMEEALRVAWTGHPCPHARKSQPDTEAFAKANKDIPLDQRVNELDAWASRMSETVAAVKLRAAQHEMWVADQIKTHEDDIAALRRDVDAMRGRVDSCEDGPMRIGCDTMDTTPAPTDALPFGCVAHQCNDGNWLIRSGDYYWGLGRWEREPRNFAHGAFPTEAKALADFHSTNGGKVPPPDYKPASEGSSATIESRVTHFDSEPTTPTGNKYEVEMCPHDIRKNRVVHDGLFMLVQNGRIRWTSDAWTPLDRVDAETFASVLRNAQ